MCCELVEVQFDRVLAVPGPPRFDCAPERISFRAKQLAGNQEFEYLAFVADFLAFWLVLQFNPLKVFTVNRPFAPRNDRHTQRALGSLVKLLRTVKGRPVSFSGKLPYQELSDGRPTRRRHDENPDRQTCHTHDFSLMIEPRGTNQRQATGRNCTTDTILFVSEREILTRGFAFCDKFRSFSDDM